MEKYFQKMRELNGSIDYEFISCSKMFVAKELNARECVLDILKEELEKVDFRIDPSAARHYINAWVEKTTKKHIKDLLPTEGVHENTKLILVS